MDLAERALSSGWRDLMRLTLPILDFVYGASTRDNPDWTLGGGTAIALRIGHRVSDDIDVFVDRTDLRLFTPRENVAAAKLQAPMQFPGNYVKYQLAEGEIYFLPGPLISRPGYTIESFDDRRVALQSCEEVVLKKVRYRSAAFKARDIFDLVAVAKISTSLMASMIEETGDRLPTLLTAIRRHDGESFAKANIRPTRDFESLVGTAAVEAASYVEDAISRMAKTPRSQ